MRVVYLLLLSLAFSATMKVFAVSGEQGVPSTLEIQVVPGSGKVYVEVGSVLVGEETQASLDEAVYAAFSYLGEDPRKYDVFARIETESERIDGPSAGLAMALLIISELTGKKIPEYVSATGTVNEKGLVGPVGGLAEKLEAAARSGIKIFMIPKGERIIEGPTPIDLDRLARDLNVRIVEVGTLEEAVKVAFGGEIPPQRRIPEFLPKKVDVPEIQKPFLELVMKYRERVAKMIDENDLRQREYFRAGEQALEAGYIYSAGNNFFGATMFIPATKSLENYQKEARSLLNKIRIRMDNLEMALGAAERLYRVLVTRDSSQAREWLWVAKEMYFDGNGPPAEFPEDYLDEIIKDGQKATCSDASVEFRKKVAEKALEMGDKVVAAFVYSQVLALCEGEGRRDYQVIDWNAKTMWGSLYNYHAMYLFQQAEYYEKIGMERKAKEYRATAAQIDLMGRFLEDCLLNAKPGQEKLSVAVEVSKEETGRKIGWILLGLTIVFASAYLIIRPSPKRKLEKLYKRGKIGEKEYEALRIVLDRSEELRLRSSRPWKGRPL